VSQLQRSEDAARAKGSEICHGTVTCGRRVKTVVAARDSLFVTSLASASSVGGTSMPGASAVVRSITSSNLVAVEIRPASLISPNPHPTPGLFEGALPDFAANVQLPQPALWTLPRRLLS
jgi:hypothetical protein